MLYKVIWVLIVERCCTRISPFTTYNVKRLQNNRPNICWGESIVLKNGKMILLPQVCKVQHRNAVCLYKHVRESRCGCCCEAGCELSSLLDTTVSFQTPQRLRQEVKEHATLQSGAIECVKVGSVKVLLTQELLSFKPPLALTSAQRVWARSFTAEQLL